MGDVFTYKHYNIISYVVVAFYVVFMLWMCTHVEALTPDEICFLEIAEKDISLKNITDYIFLSNYLGYGSFFWLSIYYLKSVLLCRLVFVALFISVILTIYKILALLKRESLFPYTVLVYLSVPLVWFTGKIIGPETISFAIAAWGVYLFLYGYIKRKKTFLLLGSFLCGMATGIKLYNIVYGVFCAAIIIFDSQNNNRMFTIIRFAIVFIIGFIIACPVIIFNFSEFTSNLPQNVFSIYYLNNVLFSYYIEWDLVNSSGLEYSILSFPALLAYLFNDYYYKTNRWITSSIIVSIIILLAICCRDRFLGWYLLPIAFFIPFSISCINKYIISIFIINIFMISPNLYYQIESKVEQIYMVHAIEKSMPKLQLWNHTYCEYTPIYYLDVSTDCSYMDYVYDHNSRKGRKELIYISHRALNNAEINKIYKTAKMNKYGYEILDNFNDIFVIKHSMLNSALHGGVTCDK